MPLPATMRSPARQRAALLLWLAAVTSAVCQSGGLQNKLHWQAVSNTATGITGDIVTSPRQIVLAGHTYPLLPVRALSSSDVANAAQILSVADAANGAGFLYRTRIPGHARLLGKNTFCGTATTTYLLLLVTGDGGQLSIANFSGTHPPDLAPAKIANSTDLCGTYAYTRASGGK